MIDQRTTLIILSSLGAGAAAVALSLADSASWPAALLTSGAAFCAAFFLMTKLIKPTDNDASQEASPPRTEKE
ncbi:hypothetical protein GCM10009799_14430 [Nocardiopsis rhodophaea]|uniref:Uncharacterized protein n=1 Tax=Nocardiopsis rhodophaea TaxID=280238 RepID=A0ABP5E0Z4_9ACTN